MPRLLTSAVLVAVIGGASAAPVPDGTKRPPLYHPIRVGDTSVYVQNGADETVVVTEAEQKDGGWLVCRETAGKDGEKYTWDMVHVGPAGVLVYHQEGTFYSPPLRVLKLPAGGAGWAAEAAIVMAVNSGPTKVSAKYKATTGGKVKVSAGVFDTVRVDAEYTFDKANKHTATAHYADGVGLVKLEVDGKTHTELKSFTRGKD